jgi:hypothetical protein
MLSEPDRDMEKFGGDHNARRTAAIAGRAPPRGVGAVDKWPAGATVQSLAEAGHLSTAVVIADLR